MATSYSRLHAQISKLQKQADSLKEAAIKRVRREIELHGLTTEDIFSTSLGNGSAKQGSKPSKPKKSVSPPKYGDGAGNVWGGMGKRPQWLKDALEAGASIEDFLLGKHASKGQTVATEAAAPQRKAAVKRRRTTAPSAAASAKKTATSASKASAKRKSKAASADPVATAGE